MDVTWIFAIALQQWRLGQFGAPFVAAQVLQPATRMGHHTTSGLVNRTGSLVPRDCLDVL